MKKVVGIINAEDIRILIKGKSKLSRIYLIQDAEGNMYLETNEPLNNHKDMEIISKSIKPY